MVKDKDNKETQAKECNSTVVNKDRLAMMIINPLNRHPHPHHLNHLDKAKEQDTPATKARLNLACHTDSAHKADQLDPNNKEVTNNTTPNKMLNRTTVTLAITRLTIPLQTRIPPQPQHLNQPRKTNAADKVAGVNL